jgi:hypothetical protein
MPRLKRRDERLLTYGAQTTPTRRPQTSPKGIKKGVTKRVQTRRPTSGGIAETTTTKTKMTTTKKSPAVGREAESEGERARVVGAAAEVGEDRVVSVDQGVVTDPEAEEAEVAQEVVEEVAQEVAREVALEGVDEEDGVAEVVAEDRAGIVATTGGGVEAIVVRRTAKN